MNNTIIKYIVLLFSIVAILYGVYDTIYDIGYNAKTAEVVAYQKAQSDSINNLSKQLSSIPNSVVAEYTKVYGSILYDIRDKPLFIVTKDGKCLPSKDFEKAYKGLLK